MTTESRIVTNAEGEVTSSTSFKEEKNADGKVTSTESSSYQLNEDGTKTESEKTEKWGEDGGKHETELLKETDPGDYNPWHPKYPIQYDNLMIAKLKTLPSKSFRHHF